MQIGELAKRGGVTVQTVRFYERSRLLAEPARKESGYRDYSQDDIHRLRFIRQAKALGFSLDEIRDILEMQARGKCPCVDVIKMARHHLEEVETQIRNLAKFRSELTRAVKAWEQSGEKRLSADAFCVLIERTMEKSPKELKRK